MARPVVPWTWARVLRDHYPSRKGSRDFLCAMHTLRTWMDEDGFAYPSLRTWAIGARMSRNTLTKHFKAAVRDGWLGVTSEQTERGKAWRLHTYRCAVPDQIELPEKDQALAESLISRFGPIENDTEGGSTYVSQQNIEGGSPIGEPPKPDGGSNQGVMVAQITPLGGSKNDDGGSNYPPSWLTLREPEVLKSLEVLNTHSEKAAVASDSSALSEHLKNVSLKEAKTPEATNGEAEPEPPKPSKPQPQEDPKMQTQQQPRQAAIEPKEVRVAKAVKMLQATPDMPTANLAKMFHFTEAEAMEIKQRGSKPA
jgi:hypothetical protein